MSDRAAERSSWRARPPKSAATSTSPRLRGHAALPSGRAAVGALLVTIAALGVLVTYARVTEVPTQTYLVAARDLEPGVALKPSDVRAVPMHVPSSLAGRVFREAASIDGAILVGPVAVGELIQRSAITRNFADHRQREVSLSIDESQAAGGRLGPGDRVDVIATFDDDDRGTQLVLGNAMVVRAQRDESRLTSGRGPLTVTLAIPDGQVQLPLVEAIHTAKISLVRVTGAVDRPGR